MKKIALATLIFAGSIATANCASYDDLNRGIQYYALGQWRAAIDAFDKALAAKDLPPGLQFTAHLDRGLAYRALGQYDQALTDYSAGLALQPDDPRALLERAIVYLNTKKLAEAGSDLDRLIGKRPMMISAYNMRAAINARLGQTDRSAEDLKTVLSVQPDSYRLRNLGTGIANWQADKLKLAEDNFSYATTAGSGNVYAWLWLSLTQLRQGKDVPRGYVPNFDRKKWPAPIVSVFLEESTAEAALSAAEEGDEEAVKGQVCEADFYIGEWLYLHKDAQSAKKLIGKAADECPLEFVEWAPAQIEMARLAQ
jgi:lipoprotein NlpI